MSDDKNEEYVSKYNQLDMDYTSWRTFYKKVSEFIWPTGGEYLEDAKPTDVAEPYGSVLIDSAEYANKILGAGMQGGLCSPSRPWFRLGLLDEDLAKFGSVKEWLDTVESVMYKVLAGSNFYESSHMGFEEQGAFGTECLYFEPHGEEIVRFYPFTAGEYRIALSADRRVDTIYRNFKMTVIQMAEAFGKDQLSNSAKGMLDRNKYTYYDVMHVIEPRINRDPTKLDQANMPWKSIWLQPEEKDLKLRVSGYPAFPAAVPRWATRAQAPYGFGPGHSALGGTQMIQEMEKTGIKGLHQLVNPSMAVSAKYKGVLDLTPGAVNYDSSEEKAIMRRLFDINLPLRDLDAKTTSIERRIERAFYNDMFLIISTLDRSDVTATEILERKEEKLLMLGPTIERQIKEKLEPVIDFVFNEVNRRGLVPPPPKEMQGQPLKAEFVSLLAQAQKLVTAQGMRTYLAEVERVAAIDEQSTVKTDLLEYLDQYGHIIGVPAKIIRSADETDAIIAEINEANAVRAQQEQALQQAAMARDLGSASTTEDTALGALKQELGF